MLILPVNNAGTLLDPVLSRTKNLYPDNYQRYHRACRDSSLMVGSCLIHKRQRESIGLNASSNSNQPSYIANLVVSDHPYHPTRALWLTAAVKDLKHQLLPMIRYQGIRSMALLVRPLAVAGSQYNNTQTITDSVLADSFSTAIVPADSATFQPLDWYQETLPLLTRELQALPKVRIDLHLPQFLTI